MTDAQRIAVLERQMAEVMAMLKPAAEPVEMEAEPYEDDDAPAKPKKRAAKK